MGMGIYERRIYNQSIHSTTVAPAKKKKTRNPTAFYMIELPGRRRRMADGYLLVEVDWPIVVDCGVQRPHC